MQIHCKYDKLVPVEWREISHEKSYFISNTGLVKNPKNKILSKRMGGYKKQYVRVSIKNKDYYVHRLVLETFVSKQPSKKHQASHLNGNPLNNNLSNLKWETPKQNNKRKILHGTSGKGEKNSRAKIKDSEVYEILEMFKMGISSKLIAEMYGVKNKTIRGILNFKTFAHLKIPSKTKKEIKEISTLWMHTSNQRKGYLWK